MATIWLIGQNTRAPHRRTFKTKKAAIAYARTVYPGQVYFVWKDLPDEIHQVYFVWKEKRGDT